MKLTIAIIFLALAGCKVAPGEECLDSFRSTLKDPESGKVLSFVDPVLTYTATNSYGARTQGKALCEKVGDGKWDRRYRKEQIAVLDLTIEKLKAFDSCKKQGANDESCAGDSFALKMAYKFEKPVDVEALKEE